MDEVETVIIFREFVPPDINITLSDRNHPLLNSVSNQVRKKSHSLKEWPLLFFYKSLLRSFNLRPPQFSRRTHLELLFRRLGSRFCSDRVAYLTVKLNIGTLPGRAGSPLPAAVANKHVLVHHGGAHGVARPICPNVAKN